MPCDTRIETAVDFGGPEVELEAVRRALEGLGATVELSGATLRFWQGNLSGELAQGGRLVVSSSYGATFDVNALKVAYAGEVVTAAAAKFGWNVQEAEAAVARLW